MEGVDRIRVFFSGRVQQVGFRWRSKSHAEQLGLVGWVRNLEDGRVELLAEGPAQQLESLLERLDRDFDIASKQLERLASEGDLDGFSILK